MAPFGYEVLPVDVRGCLHLKTAVTQVADGTVLLNPVFIDPGVFADLDQVHVHPEEPFAGNALRVDDAVLFAAAHQRTRERLEHRDLMVRSLEFGELAKAEAGLTCCSILLSV